MRALKAFAMLELETAREKILSKLRPLPSEKISLLRAAGRILAEPVVAPLDLPAFDNSAMDGYAVRSADVASANAQNPVALQLTGQVAAGDAPSGEVHPGGCVRVFTGSPLPVGADAVVMQEDTRVVADTPSTVLILDAAKPWENVRFRGHDVKQGSVVANAGEQITAGRAGLLAALGLAEATVSRQPVIGLLATGSELLEPGQTLAPGKIYESNRISLAQLLLGAGAQPRSYPLIPDTLSATEAALRKALAECDAVVTSGGVSVGEFDFVKDAFARLGGEMEFWRVAIKPGKPFVFGRCGKKFLFGLPGNPVSAFVTFLLLVRPALLHWQGAREVSLPSHLATLGESLVNRGDRRHFMRVTVDGRGVARSSGVQASHALRSLAAANGLVDVPPTTALAVGTPVAVMRFDAC